jgi:hypothetical protein
VTFDLRMSIVTISPREPALLIALLLASPLAWYLGKGLGRVTSFVRDPWRRRLYLGPLWVVAGLLFFVLPNVLVVLTYPLVHPDDREAMVCVAMVWPTFLVPTVLGIVAAARTVRRIRIAAALTP